MKVIRRSRTNVVRALYAGIVLVAAGCAVLGWNFPSRSAQNVQTPVSALDLPRATIPSSPLAVPPEAKSRALQAFSRLPLIFEPNVGQIGPAQSGADVKFLARGAGYSLLLETSSAVIEVPPGHKSGRRPQSLRMKLAGASPRATVAAADALPGKTNYFIGNDPSKWHRNVPQFAHVRYEEIYPGINLVFYGNQGRLEYDFQVAPGGDPHQVELEFDGSHELELRDGTLTIKAENANLRLEAPRVYQQIENRRQPVEGRFVMRTANRVGFEIGSYDRTRELIIDPTLTTGFSTYFGGSGDETSPSVAVDTAQNVYLAGSTTSPVNTFPQPTGALTQNGSSPNVFVAKLDSSGASVTYLTFLGGSGTDTNVGVAVDAGQNAYIAGNTSSTNFPATPSAYQSAPEPGSTGTSHVYVSVLDSTGSVLKYSSYLSGNGTDTASGMAIDNKGNLFVTGTTTSSDQSTTLDAFPAAGPPTAQQPPFQSFPFAPLQFFVTKVNTQTAGVFSIAYSTYFGGGNPTSASAVGGGIAVDSTGNIYFTGTTNFIFTGSGRPPDFPILNAYQPCLDQPPPTTIVTPPTCTYTVTPTATDAFVAKLDPNTTAGSQLIWSTYFGGSQGDTGTGIAVDTGAANVYLTGATNSPDFKIPTGTAPYQQCLDVPPPNPASGTACAAPPNPSATDAYVARLNNPATGNMSLTYFSYLGGSGNDAGSAITVDTASGAILTGSTSSGNFPFTPNAIQSVLKGTQDAFFARINTTTTTSTTTQPGEFVTYFGGSGVDRGTGIAIDNALNTYLAGDTNSIDLPTEKPLQANLNGPSDAFVAKLGTSADLCIDKNCAPPTVSPAVVSAGSQVTFTYTITNLGPDLATNIQFNDNWTGQPLTFVSAGVQSGSGSCSSSGTTAVCSLTSLQAGSTAQVKIVLTVTAAGAFNGGTVTVSSTENDPDPSNNQTSKTAQATDFTVSVSPSNLTIGAAGETGVYLVTLTPLPPPFSASISLSCSSGVPSAAACTFTTNPVTLNNGPATSTLNLTTTARPVTTADAGTKLGPLYAIWLGIPGIALLGLGASGDRRRRRIAACLLLVVLSGLLLLQPACSHQKTQTVVGGTPAGTYTIILTATSGSLSHNASFTLTVP